MIVSSTTSIRLTLYEYIPLLLISVTHIFLLNSHSPLSGMDVGYYSSRLLDLLLHFREQGILSIQWWTPSYGGGIPAFPSPLHYQYSITPYLVLIFSPWVSTIITYVIFNILGYILVIKYVKNHLDMGSLTGTLAAVIFTTSGFWICHSLAGHLSYHTFTLIAIVPYMINSKWSNNQKIIIFSGAVIYMIHSGAYFPIYLTYLSFFQLIFFFILVNKVNIRKLIVVLFLSHVIIIGVSLAKVIAVSLHMDIVPRLNSYSSWQPYFISLPFANLFQLFSWRYLYPIEALLPIPADSILFWVCGSRYEFWENDVSVSPVVLPMLLYGIYKLRNQIKKIFLEKKLCSLLMLMVFWFSAEISIGKGLSWTIIKDLPMIKSTHVNVRYCGSLILFLTILTSYFHFYLFRKGSKLYNNLFTFLAISLSVLSMFSYYFIIDDKDGFISYDRSYEKTVWEEIQDGDSMIPINSIINTKMKDHFSQYQANASSFMPNDPLYGYHGHYFISSLKVGPVEEIDEDGFFNFHNPRTFYDPKIASIPRSKIHSNDHVNLRLFINRKQPKWELPIIQTVANYITLFSIFLFFIYIVYTFLKKSKLTNS